jgi:hypothetical protein
MNETSKKYGAAVLPSVNLVPKELSERRAMRAVQVTAWIVLLIAVGVVVAGFVLGLGAKALAESAVNESVDAQAAAVEERDALAPVYHAYRQREVEEFAIAQATYAEIDYTALGTAVLATANAESTFIELAFEGPNAVTLNTTNEYAARGVVGTLIFSARATSLEEATAFIARLEQVPGLVDVAGVSERFNTDGADAYWQIEGIGSITLDWLTLRLLPEDSVTGVDALRGATEAKTGEEVEPEPSASPSPDAADAEGEEG